MYGAIPPDTEAEASPLAPALQDVLVAVMVLANAVGSVTVVLIGNEAHPTEEITVAV